MNKQLRGSLLLLFASVIWGFAFAAQDEAMLYMGPYSFNAVRMLVAGVALLPVAFFSAKRQYGKRFENRPAGALRRTLLGGLLCGIALAGASTCQQLGIKMTSAGKASFITALYIILVPVIGLLLRKRPRWIIWPCAVAALFGVYLLCGGFQGGVNGGDALLLLCALLFSVQITLVDTVICPEINPVCLACTEFFAAAVLMSVPMFLMDMPTWEQLWTCRYFILYVGLMSGALGYTLQIIGQRDCPPTAACLIMSLESVFGALGGFLFLGEKLTAKELVGCGILFLAVVTAQLPVGRKQN